MKLKDAEIHEAQIVTIPPIIDACIEVFLIISFNDTNCIFKNTKITF